MVYTPLTQELLTHTALTLESDLNSKIQESNTGRKEDTDTTKQELTKIKERVRKKLTDFSKGLEDHNTGLILLHEGQIHLELNLKLLMTKIGVTPSNILPLDIPIQLPIAKVTNIMENGEDTLKVVQDLDKDFLMMEEIFDNLLEECSCAQDTRHTNNKRKVYSPPNTIDDGDDEL